MFVARLIVVACVLQCGNLSAQDLVLENLANVARKHWVDVALPAVDAAALPRLCRFDPPGWIAYRGPTVGQHSVIFHVLADLAPNQRISGTLVPVTNNAASLPPWGMTDWVADDTFGVLPLPVVIDSSGVEHRLVNPVFELVEQESPARRVFHLGGRIGSSAFVYDAYLYVYAGQDSVDVECTFTCSDPGLSGLGYAHRGIWLESGEYLHLDYRTRLGLRAPVLQSFAPNHQSFGRWVQMIREPDSIGRGEAIFVSGAMQCFVAPGRPPVPIWYGTHGMNTSWSVADRVDGLFARGDKPTAGMWQHWEGKWLAYGMVPEVPVPFRFDGGVSDSDAHWSWFESMLQQPADLFSARPRGLQKFAGSTGGQEDFGACKGAYAVTVGDPRFLFDVGYSVAGLMMRGFHYREADGSPMRFSNHPQLQCFSQRPHCITTGDTLGYPCPAPYQWPSNGWSTYDDQHRSQNNFNAALALTGRYALRDQVRDLAEVDKAMVPGWMDTPRAEGRLMAAWANMLLLMDGPVRRQELRQAMVNRIQTVMNVWPGRQFVGNPNKPVRVMHVGTAPGFYEQGTQNFVPAIIVWEHSIAVMGFYAAWRVTGEQRFFDMAREVSRMVVERCIFQENGHWIAATAVRYLQGAQEGDALPTSSYYTGSPDIALGLSFWSWILPSVLICRELHTGTDPALVTRCNQIIQGVAPNGPSDWLKAEWWAVLPR